MEMQEDNVEFFVEIADERSCITDDHDWLTEIRSVKPKKKKAKPGPVSERIIVGSYETTDALEKIHAVNNLMPIAFLEKGAQVARSVGRVLANGGAGTGTLIGEDLLLTNNHVIGSTQTARGASVEFQFERDINGDLRTVDRRQIVDLVATNEQLDYSIVRVKGKPATDYGFVDITKPSTPTPGHPTNGYPIVIQHPGGGEKMVAVTDNHVIGVQDPLFHYTTDTMPGTSGALIFNHEWNPMGLHRAGRFTGKDPSGRMKARNEGVLLSAIVANLQAKGIFSSGREIYSKMRTLLQNPSSLPNPTQAPDVAWFYNSNFQSVLVAEADNNFEVAPLIAAAVGVAAGASAAHWGHVTSKEAFADQEITVTLDFIVPTLPESAAELVPRFIIPASLPSYGLFETAYPTVRQSRFLPLMKAIVDHRKADRPGDFELAPLAGAFLAGVAAGAAAYKAGK